MEDKTRLEFRGFFPEMQGCIKFAKKGMRITVDIPETDLPESLWMTKMRDNQLKVQVYVEKKDCTLNFPARFPDMAGLLKINRDGMRVTMEVDEKDIPKAMDLVFLREDLLNITVEPGEPDEGAGSPFGDEDE